MGWNYRVVKHVKGDGTPPNGDTDYGVYEVYYNEDGTVRGWTERAVSPGGETPKEFRGSLMLYTAAMKRPVLVIRDEKVAGEEQAIR